MRLYIDGIGRDAEINIVYERTRRYVVKVTPDMKISISCPLGAKEIEIQKVLDNAKPWIAKRMKRFESSVVLGKESMSQGSQIHYLGQRMTLEIREGKNRVSLEDKHVVAYANDKNSIEKVFDKWWKNQSEKVFMEIIYKQNKFFKELNINIPSISVKKMYTRWGSCNKRLNKVNLNTYLLCLPYECIEYVIMHELAHLVHQNHKQEFYSLLAKYMPDWNRRKKLIDDNYILIKS